MRLDGGYNGSAQQAEANLYVGREQGRREGRKAGFEEGRSQGYSEGWDAGAARANTKLEPLRDHVRQYFTEAVLLRSQVKRQQAVIDVIHEQLSKIAQAQAAQRPGMPAAGRDTGLAETITTLQNSNAWLRAKVEAMDAQIQASHAQAKLQTQQYNQSLVFVHAAQEVLEEFLDDDSPEAEFIREQFAARYQQQVALSVQDGDLEVAPHQDEAFHKSLPGTRQFIVDMLQAVASR
ncbi:hypothetical protein NP534_11600 [Pseudomonas sp. 39004]|uniref:hypothetical protein n=1 Tax=Pseudomonas sp. 39004 TaxID=2967213 RepID=UPI002363851C|nr:hypothetical protein [Pseudomonas sp. 39004]MDD1960749.1 hypothetical protein [Pseudomonas sp. 39004]